MMVYRARLISGLLFLPWFFLPCLPLGKTKGISLRKRWRPPLKTAFHPCRPMTEAAEWKMSLPYQPTIFEGPRPRVVDLAEEVVQVSPEAEAAGAMALVPLRRRWSFDW